MRLHDILHDEDINPILEECGEFLSESHGLSLLKNLSTKYLDLHKVKVRQRKDNHKYTQIFNETLGDIPKLRQRSVYVNGEQSFKHDSNIEFEPFYIFPIDGYRYIYNEQVIDSSNSFLKNIPENVIPEVLKFTYISEKLVTGINSGAEIMIYNIPYFYAIRCTSVDNYQDIIHNML